MKWKLIIFELLIPVLLHAQPNLTYRPDMTVVPSNIFNGNITNIDGTVSVIQLNRGRLAISVPKTFYNTNEADARFATISTLNLLMLNSLNNRLKEIVASKGFDIINILRDGNGIATNATVLWPDGTYGVYNSTSNNVTFGTVDAYTVTYTNAGLTVMQPTVSRNINGSVTNKPALTILP